MKNRTPLSSLRPLTVAGAAMFAVLAAIPGHTARAASLNYTDGDFGTNWSVTRVGATGSVSASRVPSGGNPNAFWQVLNSVATTDLNAISLRSDFLFNPSVSGSLTSLAFSYDTITQINGQTQLSSPALMQNGVLFDVPPINGGNTSYVTFTFANLTATSFVAASGAGTHPDFSTAGSTIDFGFTNFNYGTGANSNRTTQSDFDNFSVTIAFTPTPAPEPSTWALLGLGVVGLGVTLRQRRAARLA